MGRVVWGMLTAGVIALVAGLLLLRERSDNPGVVNRILLLGPVLEAGALAMFATEHFFLARQMMGIVPRWIPGPLFWTYLVGGALMAAAVSLIAWRCVGWSASLLAMLLVIIVATIHLPNLLAHPHERLFWTLVLRETAFAGGAMVLAGSQRPDGPRLNRALTLLGRFLVGGVLIVFAFEHFLFSRFVPGVPLEKLTPAWMPLPVLISWLVGSVELAAGVGLMLRRTYRVAAVAGGTVLALLVVLFYMPILLQEIGSPLAVEGVNYVGDTLLFSATVFLAGSGNSRQPSDQRVSAYRSSVVAFFIPCSMSLRALLGPFQARVFDSFPCSLW